MNPSPIEWTDTTWNPTTGCVKVSQGCKHCYAERLFPRAYPGRKFTDVRTHPERLEQPLRMKKPKRIFVNSMSDLFEESVPDAFIDQVWFTMAKAAMFRAPEAQHQFQILTKRPQRALDYLRRFVWSTVPYINHWPLPNVWLGVSVEDQATADERIPLLLQTPAAVRFISAEPLLGAVDLFRESVNHDGWDYLRGDQQCADAGDAAGVGRGVVVEKTTRIDWVIAGGESGPHARPSHPRWFQSLRDQCKAAGVAFFFKQWGEWAAGGVKPGGDLGGEMRRGLACFVRQDYRDEDGCVLRGDQIMRRIGKKAAGRQLDGRTHDEFPRSVGDHA